MTASAELVVTCACGAQSSVRVKDRSKPPAAAACGACGARRELCKEAVDATGGLWRCLACGHPELYSQKDFPRAAGIAIVGLAAALAPFTSYLSLAAAALIDGALYLLIPSAVVCYVCGAHHRGFVEGPRHPRFDREIDERVRYGRRAVMGKPMREGGTANAPEPEH